MASRFDDETPPKKVVPLQPKKPEISFPYTWVNDAVLKLDSKPLIKGVLEPGGFGVIYGPSGSGKSFFTADIAQHVAQGLSWRGRKVTQGLVVYVASEAGTSILKRFVGWRENRLSEAIEKIPLVVLTRGPTLHQGIDFIKFQEQLFHLQDEAKLPVALTIFDTLSRSIPGGDENKAEDMTKVVESADILRDTFNSATVFVHHTGKDETKGARGSSVLFAAADLVLKIIDKAATIEKVRDGVAGERFGFELEPVKLGVDSDGDDVYTCLLNATDATGQVERPRVLRGRTLIGLQALQEAIEADGQAMGGSTTIPKGVKAVTIEQWRSRFDLRHGKDGDRQAFYKAKAALIGSRIAISDPYVWLT